MDDRISPDPVTSRRLALGDGADEGPAPPGFGTSGPAATRALFASIVESSDDAIFAKDLDGIVLSWNRGAQRMYGYAPQEIVGRYAAILVPPGSDNDVPGILARLRRGETIESYETERVAKDGRRLRVSLTLSAIRDDDGRVVAASTIARDVTALRRGEARSAFLSEVGKALSSVLEGEEVLRLLARRAVEDFADYCVAYLLEPDGSIRRVGLAHADATQEPLLRRLLDATAPTLRDDGGAGAVVRTGEPLLVNDISRAVLARFARDPDYLETLEALGPVSSMVIPLVARGRAVGAVAFTTTSRSNLRYRREDLVFGAELADRAALALDNARLYGESRTEIARREVAERALRRRFEQLQIVYRMTDAVGRAGDVEDIYREAVRALCAGVGADRCSILLFDPDGVLRFKAWTGLSDGYRGSVEGHTPWTPETRDPRPIVVSDVTAEPGLEEGLRAAILQEGIRSLVFIPLAVAERLLGKFILYFDRPYEIAREEMDLARTIAGTIAFAITRMLDEQRVRTAKEASERANQAKSQFLGVMSHELRTPLNSVVGYADLLLVEARGPLNAEQREFVERIQSSASHQLQLVDELLTYARLEAGREELRLVDCDVRRVVVDVIEFVRPEAERKGLSLSGHLPDGPLEIVTDPARLRQIVLNLAGNAAKFTDRGEVALGVRLEGELVVVTVRDTGPGISAEDLDRIWEPFAQADAGGGPGKGGTGLGLSIARRFAHLLGGELSVESRVGEGSTFTLRLPYRVAAGGEGGRETPAC